jgi:outer membrane protein OmpA-like peptidoglycan-associated protein
MLAIFGLVTCSAANNKQSNSAQKTFLTCPIVRDTKTVPCWLAEYNGEMYYLGIQIDQAAKFQPPQLEHKVLVEGTVESGSRICGGIVLNPVRISVIPDIDLSCSTMLPAVDKYTVPFAPRGPGPNSPGYRFPRPKQPEFKPPFTKRLFTVYYDFDAERAGRMTNIIIEAMEFAKAADAKRVEIVGYRASVQLSDGTKLPEYPWIAQHRATIMAETLRDVGVSAPITVRWSEEPELGSGEDAFQKRRVAITVVPK